MVKIISDGKNKTFYAKCHKCATEFEYQLEDIKTEKVKSIISDKEEDIEAVRCPVCDEIMPSNLITKEEYDKMFNYHPYGGYCGVC